MAVAVNAAKTPLFSTEERLDLLRRTESVTSRTSPSTPSRLLADYARTIGAALLVRGPGRWKTSNTSSRWR
ncbi:MAG: hypothetical protein R2882_12760 [Gemmatimonadales bacterium]